MNSIDYLLDARRCVRLMRNALSTVRLRLDSRSEDTAEEAYAYASQRLREDIQNFRMDDGWKTMNGTHVLVGSDGTFLSGPMKGQKYSALPSGELTRRAAAKAGIKRQKSASKPAPAAENSSEQVDSLNKSMKDATSGKDKDGQYYAIRDQLRKAPIGASFKDGYSEFTKVKNTDNPDEPAYSSGYGDTPRYSEKDVMQRVDINLDDGNIPTAFDKVQRKKEVDQKVESLKKSGKVGGSDVLIESEKGYINSKSADFGKPGNYVMYRTGDLSQKMLFFAPSKEGADAYASLHDGKTSQYHVRIKNPLVVDGKTDVECINKAYTALHGGKTLKSLITGSQWIKADASNARELSKNGYDAIIYTIDGDPHEIQVTQSRKNDLTKTGDYSTTQWSRLGRTLREAIYDGTFDQDPQDYEKI